MQNGTVQARVPAIVVRGEVNGLGVVRSLAKGGVPTIIIDTTLRHAAMWSRFGRRRLFTQLTGAPFVEDLLALRAELGARPVLILTDEMSVHTVSEFRDELVPHFHLRLPDPALVRTLINKAAFHRFAEAHGFPVPRTLIIEHEADIAQLADFGMPIVVKPADKRPVYFGEVERINWLDKTDEAIGACRRMLTAAGSLIVQEWIDGPDSSIHFALFHCGAAGSPRHIFVGRKLAAHPPGLGSTAVCVPAPDADEVLRPLTERFIDAAGYQGLGSLEFKWDAREERFVIIEPTVGRTDWQEEIATLNGMNLPLIAYCHELGLPLPAMQQAGGAAWRSSFLRRGIVDVTERVYDGYFRLDDPLPGAAFCADLALQAAHRLLTRQWSERRSARSRQRRIVQSAPYHGRGLWRRSKP